MRTRNIILLIIVLATIISGVYGFFYFRKPKPIAPLPEEETNFVASLWPFGKNESNQENNPEISTGEEVKTGVDEETTVKDIKLKKISSSPVAGYGVFLKERYGETEAEKAPFVRYADKIYGNIFQTFADNIKETKFSITVIPKLYEAYLGGSGDSVIMRYLKEDGKTIETYNGLLPKEVLGGDSLGVNELSGSYMPDDILFLSLSPDLSKIFYLLPIGEGVVGVTTYIDGSNKNQVFDSPFKEWLPQWANERMITLTTKASYGVLGYVYAIDPLTKDFYKIMDGVDGLTTLTSPSGKLILYSNNFLSTNIYNIDTKQNISVGVKTLPEKCVWSEDSALLYCAVPDLVLGSLYPDVWYQGEVSFSDKIWKIDPTNGNASLLQSVSGLVGGEKIDAINLKIDQTEKYLFFMNKNDSQLWMLEL